MTSEKTHEEKVRYSGQITQEKDRFIRDEKMMMIREKGTLEISARIRCGVYG